MSQSSVPMRSIQCSTYLFKLPVCQCLLKVANQNLPEFFLYVDYVATAEDFAKANEFLLLSSKAKTACFTVTIHNDDLVEGVESFQFVLSASSFSISHTLLLERPITTVSILDDDGTSHLHIFVMGTVQLCIYFVLSFYIQCSPLDLNRKPIHVERVSLKIVCSVSLYAILCQLQKILQFLCLLALITVLLQVSHVCECYR